MLNLEQVAKSSIYLLFARSIMVIFLGRQLILTAVVEVPLLSGDEDP